MAIVRFLETPQRFGESLSRRENELESLMEDYALGGPFPEFRGVYPPVIITRSGDELILRAELPGMKLEDIDVAISGGSVIIRGERKIDSADECIFHRRERDFGAFSRAVGLPTKVNPDKCEAFYQNGVLKLLLPIEQDLEKKHISVKAEK